MDTYNDLENMFASTKETLFIDVKEILHKQSEYGKVHWFVITRKSGDAINIKVDEPAKFMGHDKYIEYFEKKIVDGVLSTLPYMDRKVRMMNL